MCLISQNELYTHIITCSVFAGVVNKWKYELLELAKSLLLISPYSSWSMCKRHWKRRSQHWLITAVYCFSIKMQRHIWRRWPLISYGDWLGETVTSPFPPDLAPTDCHPLPFPLWEVLYNSGKFAPGTHRLLCLQNTWFFPPWHCAAWNTLVKDCGCWSGLILRINGMSNFLLSIFG